MGDTLLRKGLGSWEAARDAAMGSGLQSSLDQPAPTTFNDTEQSGTLDFLAHKMRLSPRSAESGVIDKLNGQIDTFMERNYGDIDTEVEKFFAKMEETHRMEPAELEHLILSIQKVVYLATETVSKLYQDAYFADRVQQDEYWAGYKEQEGTKPTIGDRQAHAYSKSQDSRFFYYYSFMLWRRLNEKLESLKVLQRTLEFSRNRTSKEGRSWG